MSRAEEFAEAVRLLDHAEPVGALLVAIAQAWAAAEGGFPSEVEANRWSPVCSAAERVAGL